MESVDYQKASYPGSWDWRIGIHCCHQYAQIRCGKIIYGWLWCSRCSQPQQTASLFTCWHWNSKSWSSSQKLSIPQGRVNINRDIQWECSYKLVEGCWLCHQINLCLQLYWLGRQIRYCGCSSMHQARDSSGDGRNIQYFHDYRLLPRQRPTLLSLQLNNSNSSWYVGPNKARNHCGLEGYLFPSQE